MATVKGVNKTIMDATGNDHTVAPGLAGGVVQCMMDVYEASALSANDINEIGQDLPVNSKVLFVLLGYDALGASTTLDVGDAEDDNRYLSAIDTSSAGTTISNLVDGIQYEVDNTTASTPDTQILVTLEGASATGTIKLLVFYVNH